MPCLFDGVVPLDATSFDLAESTFHKLKFSPPLVSRSYSLRLPVDQDVVVVVHVVVICTQLRIFRAV